MRPGRLWLLRARPAAKLPPVSGDGVYDMGLCVNQPDGGQYGPNPRSHRAGVLRVIGEPKPSCEW